MKKAKWLIPWLVCAVLFCGCEKSDPYLWRQGDFFADLEGVAMTENTAEGGKKEVAFEASVCKRGEELEIEYRKPQELCGVHVKIYEDGSALITKGGLCEKVSTTEQIQGLVIPLEMLDSEGELKRRKKEGEDTEYCFLLPQISGELTVTVGADQTPKSFATQGCQFTVKSFFCGSEKQ